MAVRDWIDVPRRYVELDNAWGGFVSRWNGWMRDIVEDNRQLRTDIDALDALLTAPQSYTPTIGNIATSAITGRYSLDNGKCFFAVQATLSGAASSFISCTLPVAPNAFYGAAEIPSIVWNAEISATGVSYSAIGVASGSTITARRTDNMGASGAWTTAVPTIFVSGDTLAINGWYWT